MAAKNELKVLIIGGGAAGLMAAVTAGRNGARVTVLEKNQRVGKKILATGNGRCNLTNTDPDIVYYHGTNPKFAFSALSQFGAREVMAFFAQLGVVPRVEAGGKVYPASNQAGSVLDVLRYELERLQVEVICEAEVIEVVRRKTDFLVRSADGRKFTAHRLIICTGGKAAPHMGANGSGYQLAEKFGHRIIQPFPALVQLKLAGSFFKQIQGVKFDGEAEILVNEKSARKAAGEILFTEYGISGPPILQLSRKAGEALLQHQPVRLKLNLVSHLTRGALAELLGQRYQCQGHKSAEFSFVGFLNKKLIPVILREAGIGDINKPVADLTDREKEGILNMLQDWQFAVTGTTSWPHAQVTAGGVAVKEINGQTMESKLVPHLYFAGEVVDIDGDCGGYNLQWAWSSGYVAGKSAAVPGC